MSDPIIDPIALIVGGYVFTTLALTLLAVMVMRRL